VETGEREQLQTGGAGFVGVKKKTPKNYKKRGKKKKWPHREAFGSNKNDAKNEIDPNPTHQKKVTGRKKVHSFPARGDSFELGTQKKKRKKRKAGG